MSTGSTLVSSCRCCALVSRVQPVIVLSAVFWIVCSFVVCVCDMMGDQTVLAYSSCGRVRALYVQSSVSLDFPHVVVVRAFITFSDCLAFWVVVSMCFP